MSTKIFTITIAAISFIAVLAAILIYRDTFGRILSDDVKEWALFGDYFGGVVGVSLAFTSFIALLYTIHMQAKELSATTSELSRTRKAQEISIDYAKLNALIALRKHYLDLMQNQVELAKLMPKDSAGLNSVREAYDNLDENLKAVNREIRKYHNTLLDLSE